MRISTAVHPGKYCRSAPPLNASSPTTVTLGLPCGRVNEEVPHVEKDQGQGGLEAEVGERAVVERDRPFDTEFRSMLLKLMELRCGTASTVFCTQFKKKDWHPRLGGGVHADAIMDRIARNAVWVDMGEANMRQRRG